MGEQTARLELRELVSDRGRRHGQGRPFHERLRADGLPGRDVLLHDAPQDLPLAERQRHLD